eukprot:9358946-Pyramimonas_sp.AAC.1
MVENGYTIGRGNGGRQRTTTPWATAMEIPFHVLRGEATKCWRGVSRQGTTCRRRTNRAKYVHKRNSTLSIEPWQIYVGHVGLRRPYLRKVQRDYRHPCPGAVNVLGSWRRRVPMRPGGARKPRHSLGWDRSAPPTRPAAGEVVNALSMLVPCARRHPATAAGSTYWRRAHLARARAKGSWIVSSSPSLPHSLAPTY